MKMIGKRGKFSGGSEKQSALELRWCRAADCSRSGFHPPAVEIDAVLLFWAPLGA